MAGNKKVITLGLDYSQFDGSITEVNRKMGLLDAEFKYASEAAKKYGDETTQLSLKHEALTQKIQLQTKKVELAKEAYDKAMSSTKSTQKQIDSLDKALLNERTTLEKLNNELRETAGKIETAGKKSESFGDTIRGMASALGVEVSPAIETVASKFDGMSKEAGNAVLVIGTVVTALGSLTFSTAKAAGEIDELAHKTGLSTDTIQELNYAAEYLEISAEDIGSSIAKMTKNMDAARSGSGDAAEAFRKLGVHIKDSSGHLLDSEEVFYKTIDALGRVRNETEKDALSMAIFGKSAMSLNNLILEGSSGMKEYAKMAHEAGYVMDNETINAFNEFDDSMTEFNKKLEAVKLTLGEALLPVLDTFAGLLADIPTPVLVGIAVFGALAAVILSVAKAASTMAAANATLSATNVALGATGATATAGMGPLLLILLAIAAVIAIIVGGYAGIKEAMKEVETTANGIVDKSNAMSTNLQNTAARSNYRTTRGYASGTDYAEGGEAWVGENGPELMRIPRGSKIYSNSESKQLMGDTYIYVTVPVEELKQINDVVVWANGLRQKKRQGRVNIG